jgi:single-strand DNA-binding protein
MRLNKVQLIGNLGKDPEVRHLESGSIVANFPLATDESYKDKNGEIVKKAEWHSIQVWDKNATLAEKYLKKGSSVYVEGKLFTEKWTDKDGNERYTTKINGFTLQLGAKPQSETSEVKQSSDFSKPSQESFNPFPDDLPF